MIGEHEAAFAYDWRTRFGLPLAVVFDGCMSWGEAWDLTEMLAGDPSSQVAAAIAGWTYPLSREGAALLDLFDLTHRANSQRPQSVKPAPRPWDAPTRPTLGQTSLSQDEIRAALRARGHN